MAGRAQFKQADVTRLVAGAIKGGMPVGAFEVVVEKGRLRLLPTTAAPASDAADVERRMAEAFGEDDDGVA